MINEATLIGRVGSKTVKTTKSGEEMVTLAIVTSRNWRDSKGNKQEQTTWHNVNFFNKLAEVASKNTGIGQLVYVKGEINNKQITQGDKKGNWAYYITANHLKIIESHKDNTNYESKDAFAKFYDEMIPF